MNNGNCIFQSAANGGTQLIALAGAEAGGGGGEQCQVNFMLHNFIDFLRVKGRKGESGRKSAGRLGNWQTFEKLYLAAVLYRRTHAHTHT